MLERKIDAVNKQFNKYGLEVLGVDKDNGMLYSNNCMVHIEDDGSIAVAFQLGTIPEDVAVTTLILKEIRPRGFKNDVRVTDSYLIKDTKGSLVFGKDALEFWAQSIKNAAARSLRHDMILADDDKCFQA